MAKELDLSYAFYYRRQDFEATIAALDDGSLAGERLITGQVVTRLQRTPSRASNLGRLANELACL